MSERLCLLSVHAHPDDESSKGAGTVAHYHSLGVHTVLVSCTGGEEGDILNPALDRPEVRENIARFRAKELDDAAAIIGFDEVFRLGYRDSGMAGSEANAHPRCFASAPLDEAVGALVEIIRRERPQVVLTYPENQERYPHPDHLRVHEITVAAVAAAADPDAYVAGGPPWQVLKVYYSVFSRGRIKAFHDKLIELGRESPFDATWFSGEIPEEPVRTRVDVSAHEGVRRAALLAHATQIDPEKNWWFPLPAETSAEIWPWEEWELAMSRVGPTDGEDDLFAGVGQSVSS